MKLNPLCWNSQFLLKPLDETNQMTHLAIAEGASLAVPDQADSDGMGVVMPP